MSLCASTLTATTSGPLPLALFLQNLPPQDILHHSQRVILLSHYLLNIRTILIQLVHLSTVELDRIVRRLFHIKPRAHID